MIPTTSPQDTETEDLVHTLRDTIVPEVLDDSAVTAHVGGVTAALEDQSEYIVDRMPSSSSAWSDSPSCSSSSPSIRR